MYGALRVFNPSYVASVQLSSAHVDALAVVVPIATLCSLDALKREVPALSAAAAGVTIDSTATLLHSQIRCLHGGALTRQQYLHGHTLLALHLRLHQTRQHVSGCSPCLSTCLEMPK